MAVIRSSSGPVEQFGTFYERCGPDIYRTLSVALRDIDLAREATDEAMTRAYERWRKVGNMSNPSGWVYRVAMNWARSQMRKRRYVVRDLPPMAVDAQIPNTDLNDAIRGLDHQLREIVVFKYLTDMTQEQIAEVLNIPVGTVKSRLARALEALRKEIPQYEH
jgi:RNA polymerase sigma-70 factor (ECF subfamily)